MSDNIPVKDSDLDELKKEMRSAQWVDWVEKNQKSLIVAAAAVVVVLMAVGVWLENEQSQRATAATIYQQAMNESELGKKLALFQSINRDFSGSSYAALALMQMASVDRENAEVHLKALMAHGKAMDEWVWQAQLDLAEIKLADGDAAAAKSLLEQPVGEQYLQLRYYLMAQAATNEDEKQDYLQKALDAPSTTDTELMRKIESQINKNAS